MESSIWRFHRCSPATTRDGNGFGQAVTARQQIHIPQAVDDQQAEHRRRKDFAQIPDVAGGGGGRPGKPQRAETV